jgi:hypothetical protein
MVGYISSAFAQVLAIQRLLLHGPEPRLDKVERAAGRPSTASPGDE